MESNCEPRQNETVASDEQPSKQRSPRNATDDGISIASSCTQAQNARISIDDNLETDPNLTERIHSHTEKQYSPIVSISSGIVTSLAVPQYRTIERSFEFIMKSPFMWKY
jgi:hypothetical protein